MGAGGGYFPMSGTVCFSHGQESGPWGTKISVLADCARSAGWSAESLDYRGIADPVARADRLVEWCGKQPGPCVLAGSSMGGFVALAAASRIGARGLFMLAPALFVPGYEEVLPVFPDCPTMIVQGWRDDIVPWQGSVRYGSETGARVILLDGDHRLTGNIATIARLFDGFLEELSGADQR